MSDTTDMARTTDADPTGRSGRRVSAFDPPSGSGDAGDRPTRFPAFRMFSTEAEARSGHWLLTENDVSD